MNGNPLKNLIEIIKTGSPQEVKGAQKKVEKFWYEVNIPKREEGKKDFSIFLEEIKRFDEIQDIDHQAYFINTLKWPFLAIGEEYFEQWAEFILKYIQHPSGKIRRAIVRVTDYLIIDIRLDLKLDFKEKISPEEKEKIEKNKNRFGSFVERVEKLLEKYWQPKFNRYKYISSLPVGVYKSLQQLLNEVLLQSQFYEKIYNDFLGEKWESQLDSEEVEKIKQIEEKIQELIEKYNLTERLTVSMIKDWIWEEGGETVVEASNRFNKKVLGYLKNVKTIDELNEILHTFADAWNYFPHQILGGKSPNQLAKEALKKHPDLKKKTKKMPDFIVGGKKMSWDEYWAMTREVEQLQKPFKKWVQERVLPEYQDYLTNEEKWSPEIVKKNLKVAEIFFRRAMWLGFINFDEIGLEFAKYEFPRWWQSHVLGSDLDENEIWHSLKNLFRFLAIKYQINTERFFNII
ncbi:hypothetical protein J7J12_03415 [bacterium]|nr:hypothetical protein [bacterium]